LHHAELKLCFWLMHMFEIFKFEFMVWLDLNSKDKIKRKGNRNSEEKTQNRPATPPSRPFSPSGQPRPRAHPPFSPSARWGRPIGAAPFAHVPPLSLRCGPAPSALYRFSLERIRASTPWAHPVSPVFPATAADPCMHACREVQPRRLPTSLSSLLSPARTCSRSLSCSVTAARAHRRNAPAVPSTRSSRRHAENPRAPSQGEEPFPVLWLPRLCLVVVNSRSSELCLAGLPHSHDVWSI
jgi:hypothetical protein